MHTEKLKEQNRRLAVALGALYGFSHLPNWEEVSKVAGIPDLRLVCSQLDKIQAFSFSKEHVEALLPFTGLSREYVQRGTLNMFGEMTPPPVPRFLTHGDGEMGKKLRMILLRCAQQRQKGETPQALLCAFSDHEVSAEMLALRILAGANRVSLVCLHRVLARVAECGVEAPKNGYAFFGAIDPFALSETGSGALAHPELVPEVEAASPVEMGEVGASSPEPQPEAVSVPDVAPAAATPEVQVAVEEVVEPSAAGLVVAEPELPVVAPEVEPELEVASPVETGGGEEVIVVEVLPDVEVDVVETGTSLSVPSGGDPSAFLLDRLNGDKDLRKAFGTAVKEEVWRQNDTVMRLHAALLKTRQIGTTPANTSVLLSGGRFWSFQLLKAALAFICKDAVWALDVLDGKVALAESAGASGLVVPEPEVPADPVPEAASDPLPDLDPPFGVVPELDFPALEKGPAPDPVPPVDTVRDVVAPAMLEWMKFNLHASSDQRRAEVMVAVLREIGLSPDLFWMAVNTTLKDRKGEDLMRSLVKLAKHFG